jgi:hypothetical protein
MNDRPHSHQPTCIKNLFLFTAIAYFSLYVWVRQNSILVHATTTITYGEKPTITHSIETGDCGIPLLNLSYCYLVEISGWIFLPCRFAETAYWYIAG